MKMITLYKKMSQTFWSNALKSWIFPSTSLLRSLLYYTNQFIISICINKCSKERIDLNKRNRSFFTSYIAIWRLKNMYMKSESQNQDLKKGHFRLWKRRRQHRWKKTMILQSKSFHANWWNSKFYSINR